MMNFTGYEKYKDSGVEWLGEIPEDWEFKRVKDVSAINPTTRSSQKFADENKIDFLPMTNVDEVKGKIKAFNQEAYGEVKNGYTKFRNNDILFAKITPCMENGNCVIVENLKYNLGFGSTEFIVFRTNRRVDRKYFHYFLRNNSFRARAEQFMVGTAGQKRISTFFLTVHEISYPPLQTQTAIAEYLDEKTAQIDKKVALLQAKKEKYRELRKTLVNEAVTKGINKTVELKDSGVEWLGKVPKHWEVKRVKDLFKLITDLAPTDNDYQLLSIYTSIGVKPREEMEQRGNKSTTTDGYWIVKKGDFIVNKLLAWMGAMALSDYDGVTSPAYDILRKKTPLIQRYYEYLFRTEMAQAEFKKNSRGIMDVRLRLYFDKFGAISVPVQSLDEQQQIVNYLDEKTSKIDEIIAAINKNIEALNEFRKTLINDAVTGKIKVV